MMEVASNVVQPIQGTVADGLLVNLGTNNDVGINAGTNNIGDVDVVTMPVVAVTQSGTWDEVGINDSGNSITVDASNLDIRDLVQATDSVSIGDGTDLIDVLADGADNVANTTNQLVTAAILYAFDGTAFDRVTIGGGTEATALRVTVANDSTGVVSVDDNAGSLTVDNAGLTALNGAISGTEVQVDVVGALPAGTNAIGKLAANSGVDIGDVDVTSVAGGVADDATTPKDPVMVGGTAKNFDGTTPGEVSAEDDVTRAITDRNRRLLINPVHPQFWSYHLNTSTAQTDTQIQAAPGANYAVFITDIVFSSGAATAINLFFEEGSTTILGPYYLEATAGRGLAIHFVTPKQVTANTAVTYTTSASIAQAVDFTGFIARVT